MIGMNTVWHKHFTQKREEATMLTWAGNQCTQTYLEYLDRFVREVGDQMESMTSSPMLILPPHEQRDFQNCSNFPRSNALLTNEGRHKKVRDHILILFVKSVTVY